MSYLFPNYQRQDVNWQGGKGCYLEDNTGESYLDFTSGIAVTNLGVQPDEVVSALIEQAKQLWHVPNLYQNELQESVAKLLGQKHNFLAFFCNSGTEANEAAIKLARKATGKSGIISFENSFHGRTYGSMSATGQTSIHDGFLPLVPEFSYAKFNDIESVKALVGENTGAIMLELIQGESGINIADEQFIKELAEYCQKNEILLIVDEVQTGMGRTGTLFAFEQFGIVPDIVTLAKGLGNGIPVGAMLGKQELAEYFKAGTHGSTFGGNLLAMAASNAVLNQMNEELFNNVQLNGTKFINYLTDELANNPHVINVRGMGYMVGIELSTPVQEVMSSLFARNVLTLKAGKNVLRLLPALIMDEQTLLAGAKIICEVLNAY